MIRPVIHIAEILAHADAFHKRWKRWPRRDDGPVAGVLDLTWCGVDQALKKGNRGLRPGQSLSGLLHKHRGYRHKLRLPRFSVRQILTWADRFHRREGRWPSHSSGVIKDAPDETWLAVDKALRVGRRGLPGGSSVAQLLEQKRGVRNPRNVPVLSAALVLEWADAHHARTGTWPIQRSGPVAEAPGETWAAIGAAFVAESRGLSGFGSLRRFLAKKRGVRNPKDLPPLSVKTIRKWAKLHMKETGRRPTHLSGPIRAAPGENWGSIHGALVHGTRGLPGNSSLYRTICGQG